MHTHTVSDGKTRHFRTGYWRATAVLFHLEKPAVDEGRQEERQVVVYEVRSGKEKIKNSR